MSYPRFQRSRDFKTARRTAGDFSPTPSQTAWSNFDTATDVVLVAESGDVIEASVSAFVNNQNGEVNLDVVTVVSGSPVRAFSTGAAETAGTNGVSGWYKSDNIFGQMTGSILYVLQSGDISAGTVTLRLRVRSGTAAAKAIRASTTTPFAWWVKNLGPQDPN